MRRLIVPTILVVTGTLMGMPIAQADDTECIGALGPVVVDNVIVPEGEECTLEGTQVQGNALAEPDSGLFMDGANVRGNVQVKEGAATGAFGSVIGGDYQCDLCFFEDVVETTVGGNVQIKGEQDGSFIEFNVISGNVEIVESSAGNFVFTILENEIGGNIKFEKNRGPVSIGGNSIAGNLQVFENNVTGCFADPGDPDPDCEISNGSILDNEVGGDLQFFKNRGPTEISRNAVRGNLQCKENRPAPTGGGNTAKKKEGQCRRV